MTTNTQDKILCLCTKEETTKNVFVTARKPEM